MQVRRSLSSKIPSELMDGNLELGVISYDPDDERLQSKVIYTDAPGVRGLAAAPAGAPQDGFDHASWARKRSSRTMSSRPIARWCCASSRAHKVPLNMDVEMPTIETIRKLVQNDEGVAFLPRMCVEQEIEQGLLCEVQVKEMTWSGRSGWYIPTRRALSHAARAFLEVVG